MSKTIYFNLAVEDALSEAILRKVVDWPARQFAILNCYQHRGFGYLKKQVVGFNQAARITPFVLLTDLDQNECPAKLIADWLPVPRHPNFLFRVAVREVESWLLADRDGIAKFLSISSSVVPRDSDSLSDPKQELISLAKRSRRREIKEAIVPAPKTSAKQGPDYNGCLGRFVYESWNPDAAKKTSESLRRMLRRLKEFNPA